MDIIKELVRNVIVIVLIGVLFDMLMPKGSIDRYLKLVIGLFIIAAMINPLLKLTKNPDLGDVIKPIDTTETGENIETILENGRQLNKKNNEQGIKEYQTRIEQQITALAQLDKDVKVISTSVVINTESSNKKYGQIKEVNLLVARAGNSGINAKESLVTPIEINVGNEKKEQVGDKPLSDSIKNKIIKTVSNFYGLTPEMVHIQNP